MQLLYGFLSLYIPSACPCVQQAPSCQRSLNGIHPGIWDIWRVSEEGFEAAHPMIESRKKNTKSMISVEGRRRVSEINKTLHPEMKTRGPYNKHYRTCAQNYTAIGSTIHHYAPAGYFRTKGTCSSLNGKMCMRCVISDFNSARPSLSCRHGFRKKWLHCVNESTVHRTLSPT